MTGKAQAASVARQLLTTKKQSLPATRQLLSLLFLQFSHDPDFIRNVGLILLRDVEYTLAGFIFEGLTKSHPKYAPAFNDLGLVLSLFGYGEKATDAFRKAIDFAPKLKEARANLAFTVHYFGEPGRPEILKLQKDVARYNYGEPKQYINAETYVRNPDRKLRVGYVSGDLHEHPVARFMKAVLERYDKTKFEVYVFDNFLKDFESATHEGLKAKCENWYEIKSLNDEELIDLIVQNKIDVLFDLAGHTGSGRTNIFNNRIAPVQVTYLGYPNSTGIPNMDFRIGDDFSDLIEYEGQNSERMIRLPCPIWNYQPWPTMQTVDIDVEAGESATRPITFGSANNHAKLQPQWLECWARIMARVTDSRLLLKSRVMDNIDVTNAVTQIFAKHGVSSDRLEFCHYSSTKEDHWRKLQEIDIALDSYPFNGATTTCDLLWLGVPVLALAGKSHVSRTSASMLNALGLNDWIADSHEHFIDLAVEKAGDMAALDEVKAGLNARFRSSTLFDASSFLVHYEKAIRSMWQLYCEDSV